MVLLEKKIWKICLEVFQLWPLKVKAVVRRRVRMLAVKKVVRAREASPLNLLRIINRAQVAPKQSEDQVLAVDLLTSGAERPVLAKAVARNQVRLRVLRRIRDPRRSQK